MSRCSKSLEGLQTGSFPLCNREILLTECTKCRGVLGILLFVNKLAVKLAGEQ